MAAAAMIARSADFAGLIPSVSKKFLEYADQVKQSRDVADDEMSIRATGERGATYSTIRATIDQLNAETTPAEEQKWLQQLGYGASMEEVTRFETYPWLWECVADHDGFAASLPPAWR
jgi:hypothetical protein